MDTLASMDNYGRDTSEEHKKDLKSLLNNVVKPFIKKGSELRVQIAQVTGDKNFGLANDKDIFIGITNEMSKVDNFQTAEEVYVHEALHPVIEAAYKADPAFALQVNKIFKLIKNKSDYKIFLPEKNSPTKEEIKQARQLYNYVFNNNNEGFEKHEFVTYVLSNELLRKRIGKKKVSLKDFSKRKKPETIYDKLKELALNAVNLLYSFLTGKDFGKKKIKIEKILINGLKRTEMASKKSLLHTVTKGTFDVLNTVDDKLQSPVKKVASKYHKYSGIALKGVGDVKGKKTPTKSIIKAGSNILRLTLAAPTLLYDESRRDFTSEFIRDSFNVKRDNWVFHIAGEILPSSSKRMYEEFRSKSKAIGESEVQRQIKIISQRIY